MVELKPHARRKPIPLDKRKSQPRLPSVIVTREFLRDIHSFCERENTDMSELIRSLVSDKIYGTRAVEK